MSRFFCLFFGLWLGVSAHAQVRCTMPNGVVIEQRLAQTCPAGAVSGVTFDGQPVAIPKKQVLPPPVAPSAAATAKPAAKATAAPPAAQANEYDQAQLVCATLRSVGATTCEVQTSWLKESVIDATLPTSPADARMVCDQVKLAVRSRFTAMRDSPKGWRLQIYHPLGSGTRPMAGCPL